MNNQTEEIKSRLNIVTYIANSGVPLKKKSGQWEACCPFHNEKAASFKVHEGKQSYKCFGCGASGDIFSFAQQYQHMTFSEALESLAELAGVTLERNNTPKADNTRFYALLDLAGVFYQKCLQNTANALNYAIEGRNLAKQTITKWGIGYAPNNFGAFNLYAQERGYSQDDLLTVGLIKESEHGGYRDFFIDRLMIPIRDEKGRVIAFGGRAMGQQTVKYLNSPDTILFQKSNILFGLDIASKAQIAQKQGIIVVEGYMDAISAWQAGTPNVVAQMGTALSEHQLKLLARYKKVLFAPDHDSAGEKATQRNLQIASDTLANDYTGRFKLDCYIVSYEGKDPDAAIQADKSGWIGAVEKATPVDDYLLHYLSALAKGKSWQERYQLAKETLPMLERLSNSDYRHDMRKALAETLNISLDNLDAPVKVKALPAKQKTDYEERSIAACLQSDRYYSFALRKLREIFGNAMRIKPSDFANRELIEVYLAALNQDDFEIVDYVAEHFGNVDSYLSIETTREQAVRDCLRLVEASIDSELDHAELEDIAALRESQAKIRKLIGMLA